MTSHLQTWLEKQLFDRVPCNIAVIDRHFTVVENNWNFVETYGEGRGKPCYEVFKHRHAPCKKCMAAATFEDGRIRVNEEPAVDKHGRRRDNLVHLAPIYDPSGAISHVVEMSTDVTDVKRLQREYHALFERVPCFLMVLNRDYRIVRGNQHLRAAFGEVTGSLCYEVLKRRSHKCEDCPAERTFADGERHSSSHVGINRDGAETHYVVTTSPLERGDGDTIHYVLEMALDVTERHRLEREKIEAERLAAVGQTVAGLAHGIKNVLMGLEGGMYVVDTGMKRGDRDRIERGWGMLRRNTERIGTLAKNLLSFSKGRTPKVTMVSPAELVHRVVELYGERAEQDGIHLAEDIQEPIELAPMSAEDIHIALENLVSNALDACKVTQRPGCGVTVGCRQENGDRPGGQTIVFEVEDEGCGMDYEVKRKAFTNFFTTKGSGGTGIGLLLTRKIVQEHGGQIEVESEPDEGSTFRLLFPRDRLPPLTDAGDDDDTGD
jgi:PAS domain S-box-containing protein